MKGYIYAGIALVCGVLLYGSINKIEDYGEEKFAHGYDTRVQEENTAKVKLEQRLQVAKDENTELALKVKQKETQLEQARNETPKQVIRYVTKAQTESACNLSRGNVWLLNAKAADCSCSNVERCSGLSITEARQASDVTGSVHMQYSTRLAEFAAYAVVRHNALVEAVKREKQAGKLACLPPPQSIRTASLL